MSGNEKKRPSGAARRKTDIEKRQKTEDLQKQAKKAFESFYLPSSSTLPNQNPKPGSTISTGLCSSLDLDCHVSSVLDSNLTSQVEKISEEEQDEDSNHADVSIRSTDEHNQMDLESEKISSTETPSSSVFSAVSDKSKFEGNDFTAEFDISDPATWPFPVSKSDILLLLSKPPEQVHLTAYPPRNGYFFSAKWYQGSKSNNENFIREWLMYSLKRNSIFCFACCCFSDFVSPWANFKNQNSSCSQGYEDFKHLKRGIETHEDSTNHKRAMIAWKTAFSNNSLLNTETEKINTAVKEWVLILRAILDAVLFLAKNNLAFQGSSQNITERNCGNFLNLIKLLAKYDPSLALHVKLVSEKKGKLSYLSPKIQNEFINICGSEVKTKVLEKVKNSKYFSILFDGTQDISRIEQVSQIIRTVECSTSGCKVKEYFIDFIAFNDKEGNKLSDMIQKKIATDGLDIKDCRGQGYDNGSNMAGKINGVQALICNDYPLAKFIPCAAHSLNRVGVNAVQKCLEAKLALGRIQSLYVFFSASPERWEFLTSSVKKTLKGHCETRWASKANAVSALREQYLDILNCLEKMSESADLTAETILEAGMRLNDLRTFKSLLSVIVWDKVLNKIATVSGSLQTKDIDISDANKLLRGLLDWLEDFRLNGFRQCLQIANKTASDCEIDVNSGFDTRISRGRRALRLGEQAEDAALAPLKKFEVSFFNETLDLLIAEFRARFGQIKETVELFSFMWGDKLVRCKGDARAEYVKKLCQVYAEDLNCAQIFAELEIFGMSIESFLNPNQDLDKIGPLDILNILYQKNLVSTFSNIETALRIFLTLPVTTAENERAFSKLKIIKNYLRSSMGQERLSSLGILSIENEIVETLCFDDMILKFAQTKLRKVILT